MCGMTNKVLKMTFFFVALSAAALATLCQGCAGRSAAVGDGGDTVQMRYARHISIVRHGKYTEVTLANPWKRGAELHRYVLVGRKDSAAVGQIPEGTVVYTPVRRSVVFTAPHCWLLGAIGAADAVSGVCDLAYINLARVHEQVRRGRVVDCGNSMSPSVERIVDLRPEALFVSPFDGVSYGQIDHLGVPIVECADYMETSALGRAEWMRFYGMLVGKEREADSLFAEVERNYHGLRTMARRVARRPKVVTERVVSGVWYCPGGRSSMGRLLADAGANYVFASDGRSGSLTLSPEAVVARASDADYWLFVGAGPQPMTRSMLRSEYKGYAMLKAFGKGNVYECVPGMGNPYFEEASFRPDWLLECLVEIMHPELKIKAAHRYYKRIDE